MEKGNVIEHRKSGNRYAIHRVGAAYVDYIGVRDGKEYGPVRGASHATIARNFVLVAGLRAVFENDACLAFRLEVQ